MKIERLIRGGAGTSIRLFVAFSALLFGGTLLGGYAQASKADLSGEDGMVRGKLRGISKSPLVNVRGVVSSRRAEVSRLL
jgi:hypothetical protein